MNKEEAIEKIKLSKNTFLFGREQTIVNIKEIDTVLNYIEELEEKIKVCTDTGAKLISTKFIKNNFIPKQKIRDKIEELEEEDLEIYDTDSEDLIIAKYEQRAVLDFAQQLLNNKEEK